jgi:5-methylcytosine-specific restriction endonuclease McrA
MDIKEVRKKIFERDDNKCYKCKSTKGLVLDHVNPKSKFHYHGIDNILTLCWRCNSLKFIWILPQNEFDEVKKYLEEVNKDFTDDEATEMAKVIEEYSNIPRKKKIRSQINGKKIIGDWKDMAIPNKEGILKHWTIYRMRDK